MGGSWSFSKIQPFNKFNKMCDCRQGHCLNERCAQGYFYDLSMMHTRATVVQCRLSFDEGKYEFDFRKVRGDDDDYSN